MGLKGLTMNTAPEDEPHIYAEDDAAIFQSIVGADGVANIGKKCAATVISNNKVRIADGVLCVGGHFARIPYGDYVECEIANGQSGKKRNDIIIAKFSSTGTGGIDTMTCEVKKGTAGTTATDPTLTQNDLYQAGKVRELPLYRVKIEGLSITAVEPLFEVRKTIPDLEEEISSLNGKSVTESGKSGMWNYRKWANGDAECWGKRYISGKLTGIYGSCYFGSPVQGVDYPFTFTQINTVLQEIETANADAFILSARGTTSTSPITYPYGFVLDDEFSGNIYTYVKGTWK